MRWQTNLLPKGCRKPSYFHAVIGNHGVLRMYDLFQILNHTTFIDAKSK